MFLLLSKLRAVPTSFVSLFLVLRIRRFDAFRSSSVGFSWRRWRTISCTNLGKLAGRKYTYPVVLLCTGTRRSSARGGSDRKSRLAGVRLSGSTSPLRSTLIHRLSLRGDSFRISRVHIPLLPRKMNFVQYYDEAAVKSALRGQIEHYFSKQNLVRDIFLRQRMDREGYIPCEMLFGFPRVRAMCFSIEFMLAAIKDSDVLDVDIENEKVRVKGSWKAWLFPSSDGTLGVPLYSKFPRHSASMMTPINQYSTHLSPSAASSDELSTDEETASESVISTPSTPTRSSTQSTPSASPVPKVSLSVDAAEWTPSY